MALKFDVLVIESVEGRNRLLPSNNLSQREQGAGGSPEAKPWRERANSDQRREIWQPRGDCHGLLESLRDGSARLAAQNGKASRTNQEKRSLLRCKGRGEGPEKDDHGSKTPDASHRPK